MSLIAIRTNLLTSERALLYSNTSIDILKLDQKKFSLENTKSISHFFRHQAIRNHTIIYTPHSQTIFIVLAESYAMSSTQPEFVAGKFCFNQILHTKYVGEGKHRYKNFIKMHIRVPITQCHSHRILITFLFLVRSGKLLLLALIALGLMTEVTTTMTCLLMPHEKCLHYAYGILFHYGVSFEAVIRRHRGEKKLNQ